MAGLKNKTLGFKRVETKLFIPPGIAPVRTVSGLGPVTYYKKSCEAFISEVEKLCLYVFLCDIGLTGRGWKPEEVRKE